jgi:hypothetical protein
MNPAPPVTKIFIAAPYRAAKNPGKAFPGQTCPGLCSSGKSGKSRRVKRLFPFLAICALILFAGCLAVPNTKSGGPGSVVVPNTNPTAIFAAANDVFPQYGYSSGTVNYPASISFDKASGAFGKILYGSYGTTTSVRVRLFLVPLSGNNYQLRTKVYRVTDAGEAGFEDSRAMLGLWSGEFKPLLQKISAEAANAGPM